MEALVALVVVTFLTKQLGENSHTPRDPVAVYDPEGAHKDLNFNEECSVCYASDDNRQVAKQKYGTLDVELPPWLGGEEWLSNRTRWKWTWGCGCDKSWPEQWQRFLAGELSTAQRLAVVKLLKVKKYRSPFRKSLREQFDSWMESPFDERKYHSPFSHNQWMALTRYELRHAEQVDSSLYYGGRYSGWGE